MKLLIILMNNDIINLFNNKKSFSVLLILSNS